MRKLSFTLILILLLIFVSVSTAQQAEPNTVTIEAEDGLMIVGDYYVIDAPGEDNPAVLLLHMLGSNRSAWEPLIDPLLNAGFNVLAIDMRGHGETGGSRDWDATESDIQVVMDWLYAQPEVRPSSVSIVGGSIGSNMALIGCANDPSCVTAIALSPGLDYSGVMPEESVVNGLAERSALLVGSRNDGSVQDSILQMAANAPGEIGLHLYPGRVHGTNLLTTEDHLNDLIIDWLTEHMPPMDDSGEPA